MTIQKKKDFLVNCAYWAIIALAVYAGFKYLLPISVPFIFGIGIAFGVLKLSKLFRCSHRVFRITLAVVIYGIMGLLVTLMCIKGVDALTAIIKWLPELYEHKLLPLVLLVREWFVKKITDLDPTLLRTLEMVAQSLISSLKSLISYLSSGLVNLASGLATGVPNLILSILAMIFSTVFVVADYERIAAFASQHVPVSVKTALKKVRFYLTDTLFVVIRSYIIIMTLTFTELSILFSLFGIENAVLKASIIAILDIMPILGTGGIMIPWAIISFVLGYTKLGLELLLIYGIVTVVRNYVEPKIVGTQLGLHPIITLIAMFIGLRLFGFWGLFGLPVAISFFWKERGGDAPAGNGVTSAGQ